MPPGSAHNSASRKPQRETPSLSTSCRTWRGSSWLEPLQPFARLGAEPAGRRDGFRFILGPWRGMLLVEVFDEDRDRVAVVTVQDARPSTAATAQ